MLPLVPSLLEMLASSSSIFIAYAHEVHYTNISCTGVGGVTSVASRNPIPPLPTRYLLIGICLRISLLLSGLVLFMQVHLSRIVWEAQVALQLPHVCKDNGGSWGVEHGWLQFFPSWWSGKSVMPGPRTDTDVVKHDSSSFQLAFLPYALLCFSRD